MKTGPCALLPLIFLFAVLAGCNLFSPFYSSGRASDYAYLVELGNQSINTGKYQSAVDYYEKAMDVFPTGSEARFFHAKAIIKLYGLNLTELKNEFNSKRNSGEAGVPFIDSTTRLSEVDSIYYPIATAAKDLLHIVRLKNDTISLGTERKILLLPDGDTASDGVVSVEVATLDLGLLQAMKSMLAPIDLDGNFHLDSACSIEALCKDGAISEVNRFATYKKLTASLRLDSLSTDDIDAKDISTNPGDINDFLDAMLADVTGADQNIGDAYADILANDTANAFAGDLSDMGNSLSDLGNFLIFMRHNDSIDNDRDAGSGLQRMVWHDYNGDAVITWDYDYDPSVYSYPNLAGGVGHPLHRFRFPEIYLSMEEYSSQNPDFAADTSVNSRLNQMIQRCEKISDDLLLAKVLTESEASNIHDKTCREISAIPRPDVSRPNRSDWLSGTWGIDEEVLDGIDNDNDGLTDEDSRNAAGMDDDRDAVLDVSMVGSAPSPMIWTDANQNGCVDISATPVNPANPDGRENCIGTFENRLWWARNNADTLMKVYSPMTDDFGEIVKKDFDQCLDDMETQASAFASDYSVAEKTLACEVKHIWMIERPTGGEWSSGVFGIDEELKDEIDNDGDGWVDEDLK